MLGRQLERADDISVLCMLDAMLIAFNKPYHVLPQFTDDGGRVTLAEYITLPDVYPAGRLDYDSEGLLLLTDQGWLQHLIASPHHQLPKTYWVQVEGIASDTALSALRTGIELKDGITRPAKAHTMQPPSVWERNPPIRVRKTVPDSWIELTIHEGKNRQVRRMTAAVGHPTLRLIRWKIGPWTLDALKPGEWREIHLPTSQAAVRRMLGV